MWEWSKWGCIFVGKGFSEEPGEFFSCRLWNCILKEELVLPPPLLSSFSSFFIFFFFSPSKCSAGPQEARKHRELPTEVVT